MRKHRLVFSLSLVFLLDIYALGYTMPSVGFATMTHYYLPMNAIAACGCTAESTHYPTAALSALAYGSTDAFGPGCGRCFRLQLINTIDSTPTWYPASPPSIVIKVTDLCPLGGSWCNATSTSPNAAGLFANFDLAWDSPSDGAQHGIPENFYPTNVSYYGYSDFGVWNVSYTAVPCEGNWGGSKNSAALGSVPSLGPEGACCPADPVTHPNTTCPSYSAHTGHAPNTSSSSAQSYRIVPGYSPWSIPWLIAFISVISGALACSI